MKLNFECIILFDFWYTPFKFISTDITIAFKSRVDFGSGRVRKIFEPRKKNQCMTYSTASPGGCSAPGIWYTTHI